MKRSSNPNKKKKVVIYARGSCKYDVEPYEGKAMAILSYRGVEKSLYRHGLYVSPERIIYAILADAVSLLKTPCELEIHCNGGANFKNAMNENKKAQNKDIASVLNEKLVEGKHNFKVYHDNLRQSEMKELLYEYINEVQNPVDNSENQV